LAQGRFRYYRIVDEDVAALIEGLANFAAKVAGAAGKRRPVADELRQSRSCYCHLAGQLGVLLADALVRQRLVRISGRTGEITDSGLLWRRSEQIDFNGA